MTGSLIQETALEALRSRTLIRLAFAGGDPALIRTEIAEPDGQCNLPESIARLVDFCWQEERGGRHDGALIGVTEAAVSDAAATLACRTIRYRDYLATDRVLESHPDTLFPLAVGVHAIMVADEGVVCLRLNDGRIALPGGAADADDLRDGAGGALVHAARREILEETGIALESRPLQVTGLYVGGRPTHLLAMLAADLRGADVAATIRSFSPADALDRVGAIELHPMPRLLDDLETLPLVVRAALKSLRHFRGDEPAPTIMA